MSTFWYYCVVILWTVQHTWLRSINVQLPFGKSVELNLTGLDKLGTLPETINLPFHQLKPPAGSHQVLKLNYGDDLGNLRGYRNAHINSPSKGGLFNKELPTASDEKSFGVINLPFSGMKLPFSEVGQNGEQVAPSGNRAQSMEPDGRNGPSDSFGVSSGEDLTGNLNTMFRRGPDDSTLPMRNKLYLPMSVMNLPLNNFRLPLSKVMLPLSRIGTAASDPATAYGTLAVQQLAKPELPNKPTLEMVLQQLSGFGRTKNNAPTNRKPADPTGFRQSMPMSQFDLLTNSVADLSNALLPPFAFDFNDFGLPMSFLNTPFSFFNLPFAFTNLPFGSVSLPLSHINNPLGALNLPLVEMFQSLQSFAESEAVPQDYANSIAFEDYDVASGKPVPPALDYEQPLIDDSAGVMSLKPVSTDGFKNVLENDFLKSFSPILAGFRESNETEVNDTVINADGIQEYLNTLLSGEHNALNLSDPEDLLGEYDRFSGAFRSLASVPDIGGLFGFPSSIFVTPLSLFNLPLGFLDNPFAFTNLPFSHFNLPFSHLGLPFTDFGLPFDAITMADESLESNLEKPVDAADLPPSLLEAIHPDDYMMSYLNLPLSEVNLPFGVFDMPFGLFDMPLAFMNLPLSQINTPLTNVHLPFEFASLPLSDLAAPFQNMASNFV